MEYESEKDMIWIKTGVCLICLELLSGLQDLLFNNFWLCFYLSICMTFVVFIIGGHDILFIFRVEINGGKIVTNSIISIQNLSKNHSVTWARLIRILLIFWLKLITFGRTTLPCDRIDRRWVWRVWGVNSSIVLLTICVNDMICDCLGKSFLIF